MTDLPSFDLLRERITARPPGRFVAVAPHSADAMASVAAALEAGCTHAILTGSGSELERAAHGLHLDPSRLTIVDAEDDTEAVQHAVALVRGGEAEFVVKGSLPTSTLLRGMLGRSALGAGALASHVYLLEAPAYSNRPIAVTDSGVNISPTVEEKGAIIRNTIALLALFGVDRPRIAVLSAIEKVNPALPSSVHAAELAARGARGEFGSALVDGPLPMDAAMLPAAARAKMLGGEVAGRAEVLVAPDLDTANVVGKALIGGLGRAMGIIVGAAAPVALPSRGDTVQTRTDSILLAAFVADRQNEQRSHP